MLWVLIRIASENMLWVLIRIVPTIYVFMENWQKLSFNYHQISTLSVPLIELMKLNVENLRCWTKRRLILFPNLYNEFNTAWALILDHLGRDKRICVFEHSVMTNFNCACPVIQRGQGSGFLSEGSSWLTAYMSEQRRFWRDCADAQARLNLRCSQRL